MIARTDTRARCRRTLAGLALAWTLAGVALGLTGCDPRQMLYFVQPFEPKIAHTGPSLKGKKVVVVTRAAPGAISDFVAIDRELTREVANILREKVRRITVVDPDKVYAWDQAHPNWTDPAELADAFDADAVVFLELNAFQIQDPNSPDMFEGKSSVHVRVIERDYPTDDRGRQRQDQPKETRITYDDDRDTAFPVRGPIPASSELSAAMFKNKFLKLVATEISWFFVDHAPGDNIQDVRFSE